MADHALDWQARCPFWPQDVANRYREAGIWRYETFFDLLARQPGRLGGRTALIDGARHIGYDRLHRDALALAGGLAALGLVRGHRVVVQFPNRAEFVTLFFALCRLGVVLVLALPGHRDLEIGQFADFTGARAVLTVQEPDGHDMVGLARRVQARCPSVRHVVVLGDSRGATPFDSLLRADVPLPAGPNCEDVACFQISGGTTGVPKLIPRRHMEYLYNIRMAVAAGGLDGDARYLCVLPMMHNFPMACPGFLGTLMAGGTVVVAPEPEAGICFDLIARHRVTATALVPPLALLWLDAQAGLGADLCALRLLQVGGATLNPSSARRIRPGPGWAASCSRSSAWPRGWSASSRRPTAKSASSTPRAGRCRPGTSCASSVPTGARPPSASRASCRSAAPIRSREAHAGGALAAPLGSARPAASG